MKKIFYNNKAERNLNGEIIRQIRAANTWIKACNLLFDDPTILKELLAALGRGVAVFILTNLEGVSGEVYTKNSTGKKSHAQQTTQHFDHSLAIKRLYQNGAHISGIDGLHAKFLLSDHGTGLITSSNFTPNSIGKISELGVVLNEKEFDEAEAIFDQLFLRPDRFHFAGHDAHFSYERPSDTIDSAFLSRMSKIKMTLAPTTRGRGEALSECNIHDLRDEIFDIINSTERGETLYIATYSLHPNAKDSNGEELSSALNRAKQRGVKLKIVMRNDKKPEGKKGIIKGIFIHYHDDNHAKIVMNGKRGILFTGNLTTESFETGFDLGITLSPEQIAEATKFIDILINQTKSNNDAFRRIYRSMDSQNRKSRNS